MRIGTRRAYFIAIASAVIALAWGGLGHTPEASAQRPCGNADDFYVELGGGKDHAASKADIGAGCTLTVAVSRPTLAAGDIRFTGIDGGRRDFAGQIQMPPPDAACRIHVVPTVSSEGFPSAEVYSETDCDGFIVSARFAMPGRQSDGGTESLGTDSAADDGSEFSTLMLTTWMRGELEAKDGANIVMVEQRMDMHWSYNFNQVWGGWKDDLPPNYDCCWYWIGPKYLQGPILTAGGAGYFSQYSDAHKSDGFPLPIFPDTYFYGTIYLNGYADGSGVCNFNWSWNNQYTGTHADPTCHGPF